MSALTANDISRIVGWSVVVLFIVVVTLLTIRSSRKNRFKGLQIEGQSNKNVTPKSRMGGLKTLVMLVAIGTIIWWLGKGDKSQVTEPDASSPSLETADQSPRSLEDRVMAEHLFAKLKVCIVSTIYEGVRAGETSRTALELGATNKCEAYFNDYKDAVLCNGTGANDMSCSDPKIVEEAMNRLVDSVFTDMVRSCQIGNCGN